MNARAQIPEPVNEPILSYAPGTPEREELQAELKILRSTRIETPLWIGGKKIRTKKTVDQVCPHEHRHVLGSFHAGGAKHVEKAVEAALEAKPQWEAMSFEARSAVFLKAADLLAGPWRQRINAATMLNMSKNAFQAEIDAACELIDFWRFNVRYAQRILEEQPISVRGLWNSLEARSLEGFVLAITPFNFTSIAANLPTAPALFGNVAIWKPSWYNTYVAGLLMELLEEAGLPDGVINLVPGEPAPIADAALSHPDLAGIHYTGSTKVFRDIWTKIGKNQSRYKGYPRVVGETGGKDFVFAHPSADVDALAVALVRGAFEYQGQKCSAASRAYIPKSIWPKVRDRVAGMLDEIKTGGPEDFSNFVNAVIHRQAFNKHKNAIAQARKSAKARILFGGGCDDSTGYFVEPTVIEAREPHYKTMIEELFGPILTAFVYPDGRFRDMLEVCDATSPYALTGAIFAQDRSAIETAREALRHSAGNFYINDKPTGAVVGQQPFGGSRASGTNDKAGAPMNLQRWVSYRAIKETFDPPKDYRYPFLA